MGKFENNISYVMRNDDMKIILQGNGSIEED